MKNFKTKTRKGCIFIFIWFVIISVALVGEVRCIVKLARCDWDPIGKAEIIYGLGVVTGAGAIIGWIDIEDSKESNLIK